MAYIYKISIGPAPNGPWISSDVAIGTTDTISGLAEGTPYYFQFITVDTLTGVESPPTVFGPFSTAVGLRESIDGFTVTSSAQTLYSSTTPGSVAPLDGPFDAWSITGYNGSIVRNGKTDIYTSFVIGAYYTNHYVYQTASVKNEIGVLPGWWQWTGGTTGNGSGWTPCQDPHPISPKITIATISNQAVNMPFLVSGLFQKYVTRPTLNYADGAGSFQALPANAQESLSNFSFVHPGLVNSSAGMTVSVRDANATGVSGTSNAFAIISSAVVTVTNIVLSNLTLSAGQTPPAIVGTISVSMSNNSPFNGVLSVGGTDRGAFAIQGSLLVTSQALTARTYSIDITAAEGTSSYTKTVSILATSVNTPTINGITLSNTSVGANQAPPVTVGMIGVQMSSGSFNGNLSLGGTARSSFSIQTPNTLVTAASLTASAYSLDITATQNAAAFTKNFSITTTASPPPPPPPPTGGPGPAVTSQFATVDFGNLTNAAGQTNVTIYPQLFGTSSAGISNNGFTFCNNSTFQQLVTALNPGLLRVGSNTYDYSSTPSNIAPFAQNASKIIRSTCTLILGAWCNTQAQYQAVSDYWETHGTHPCRLYEVGNEHGQGSGSYDPMFSMAVNGYKQTNSANRGVGPVVDAFYMPYWGGGDWTAFLNSNNAGTLGMNCFHGYLYCWNNQVSGGGAASNSNMCLGRNNGGSDWTADMMPSMLSYTQGTYAEGLPTFLGEWNNECSASWNDMRSGTCIGAAFMVSSLMNYVANSKSTQQAWAGVWDLMDDGGAAYQLIDANMNVYPQYYTLQQLRQWLPGSMVNASAGNNLMRAWGSKSGTSFGVAMVNGTGNQLQGQVALSHWPVNSTGNGTVTVWAYPTTNLNTPVTNTPGTTSTVTVTAGLTGPITVPAYSCVILHT